MNSGAVVAAASAITMAGDPIKLFLLEQREGPLAQFDGVCYNAPVLYLNSVGYAIGHAQADSYTGDSGFHPKSAVPIVVLSLGGLGPHGPIDMVMEVGEGDGPSFCENISALAVAA